MKRATAPELEVSLEAAMRELLKRKGMVHPTELEDLRFLAIVQGERRLVHCLRCARETLEASGPKGPWWVHLMAALEGQEPVD